jgi:nucleoside-diphosphate-sugar epimerase
LLVDCALWAARAKWYGSAWEAELKSLALVTGGGGFLGSRIVSTLLDEGWQVRSFSTRTYPELTRRGVSCYAGDLRDGTAVGEAVRGCDVVFHAGAKLGIWGDSADYYGVNVGGTANVIQACRAHGVRRLVFTSSPNAVFSGRDLRNVNENAPYPKQHMNPYASTKAQAEQRVLAANGRELATAVLRPHILWGPGDNQFLPRLKGHVRARRMMLIGDGENLVDPVFVDTAARVHVEAGKRLFSGSPVAGKVYFISQGDPRPMRQFLKELMEAEGLGAVERRLPFPAAYAAGWLFEAMYGALGVESEPPLTRFAACMMARTSYFDISAARRDLDYQPETFAECLRRLRGAAMAAVPSRIVEGHVNF